MNRAESACRFYTFIIILGLPHLSWALTLDIKNVKDIMKPDQVLWYQNTESNNIALMIQDGVLQIGWVDNEQLMKKVKHDHYELLNNGQLTVRSFKEKYTSWSILGVDVDSTWVMADSAIILQSGHVNVTNCVLQAKDILIPCVKFKADNCFVSADTLILGPGLPYWLIKYIRFTFSKDLEIPRFVQGAIDFYRTKTGSGIFTKSDDDIFIVAGASKVEIAFSKKAFK